MHDADARKGRYRCVFGRVAQVVLDVPTRQLSPEQQLLLTHHQPLVLLAHNIHCQAGQLSNQWSFTPRFEREALITQRACFILATNNLDQGDLSDADILTEYQGQGHVERGFRFLKAPMFLASTLFLKKVERIMALLMGMTVCLLVYAVLEHRIRKTLQQHHAHVPNQKGKPTNRPTARWVFELFLDVHLLTVMIDTLTLRTLVMNLQDELKTLLVLLGQPYEQLYS